MKTPHTQKKGFYAEKDTGLITKIMVYVLDPQEQHQLIRRMEG
jgi:hypothetical protein